MWWFNKKSLAFLVSFGLISALLAANYFQPIDDPLLTMADATPISQPAPENIVTWPSIGQSSVGTLEDGLLLSGPSEASKPTASVAKLITALTVLKHKPLLDETGPVIKIGTADVDFYNYHLSIGGSTVAVKYGDEMTERQMLEGLLIRSGNNLADSLAIWAFGDFKSYQAAAQTLVTEIGMINTVVGSDASGLSADTISTADDLVRLGVASMKHPVVRDIVKQTTFYSAHEGSKPNTNWLLGKDGVVGIKTGTTGAAGGVFIIADEYTYSKNKKTTLIAAVQGAKTSSEAISESKRLVDSIKPHFNSRVILKANTKLATLSTSWGESVNFILKDDLTTSSWAYEVVAPTIKITTDHQKSLTKGQVVGAASAKDESNLIITDEALAPPSFWWKLTTSRLF